MDIIDEISGEWEWLEQYWISQFKSWGFNLKNMTEGGDINPTSCPIVREKLSSKMRGIPKTEEHRKSISKAKKGVSVHTEESKKKISEKTKGRNNPFYGRKHNEDSLSKMKIKVYQYTLKKELIKVWDSATDVERETGWRSRSISRCASGERKTAFGFIWIYENGKGRGN